MHVGRRIRILLVLAVGLAGCRAGGPGSLSLMPRRSPAVPAFDVDAFVDEHNRNAQAIDSLEARPAVRVASRLLRAGLDGRMAFERPRNFKLEVDAEGLRQADIGSNAEEFWFWVTSRDKDQKWIYWCPYRELASSELPVTYQPDWILAAMGLEPIEKREADAIKVKRGPESGTARLVFPPTRDRGEPFVREMIVSTTDYRVKRLRIYTEKPRQLIAEAVPSDYQTFEAGRSGRSETTVGATSTCSLPVRMRLDWKRDQLSLDVTLKEVSVNQFDHTMAADIFVEPEMPGYERLNLAEMSPRKQTNDRTRTRTRQSMPPPSAGPGQDIELGQPTPIPDDDSTVVPSLGSTLGQPKPPSLDLVGAPVSRPPESAPLQSAALPGIPGRNATIER